MSEHYIIKCSNCGTTIGQCRCMSPNKTVKYELCQNCAKEEKDRDFGLLK